MQVKRERCAFERRVLLCVEGAGLEGGGECGCPGTEKALRVGSGRVRQCVRFGESEMGTGERVS